MVGDCGGQVATGWVAWLTVNVFNGKNISLTPDVIERAGECADPDDAGRSERLARLLLIELGEVGDRELEAGMFGGLDQVDVTGIGEQGRPE